MIALAGQIAGQYGFAVVNRNSVDAAGCGLEMIYPPDVSLVDQPFR